LICNFAIKEVDKKYHLKV